MSPLELLFSKFGEKGYLVLNFSADKCWQRWKAWFCCLMNAFLRGNTYKTDSMITCAYTPH